MSLTRISSTILTTLGLMLTMGIAVSTVSCDQPIKSQEVPSTPDILQVVTTVSPITSLAENIGGEKIQLEGIIPEGTNSHTYEPAPSVAQILSKADIIIMNGLFLEQPSLEMAKEAKKKNAVILQLGDNAITQEEWIYDFSFPESTGHPNPHLWTDPLLALKYAELILEAFVAQDPDNANYYQTNFNLLQSRIKLFDDAVQKAVATIPPNNRKLLTYHDSFPYFSTRYGFTVIGAVQPSDFREPSAREVVNLIKQISLHQVPAIFGSEVFPSDIMEQIAQESGAIFVEGLRDDDLPGSAGDIDHTYLGLMVSDINIIVTSLGGTLEALEGFDSSLVFDGPSSAIYPE